MQSSFSTLFLKKLIPYVKLLVPNAKRCHFFSDWPTLQYRNKTIFKLISHHKEYFGLEATWNYSRVGNDKGPCDPIGGTAKRQANMAVRHGKVIIQDAADIYSWVSSEPHCIDYLFINVEDYQESFRGKTQQASKWLFSLPSRFCFSFSKSQKYSIGEWPLINDFFSANTDSDHNDGDTIVEVDDYVAAVYGCKAYVGKVLEVD